MKQKLWITLATCLAYCIDKELYKAIDYLREQVRVLVEHQEKQSRKLSEILASLFDCHQELLLDTLRRGRARKKERARHVSI